MRALGKKENNNNFLKNKNETTTLSTQRGGGVHRHQVGNVEFELQTSVKYRDVGSADTQPVGSANPLQHTRLTKVTKRGD